MGRRRRRAPRKARQGPGHNEANRRTSESRGKGKFLDERLEHEFRFYSEEALEEAEIAPETWRPFLQTMWIRGSRNGIDEAKEFLDSALDEGIITDDVHAAIKRLIRRYTTVR